MSATVRTEFSVPVPHKPGVLAKLLETLAKSSVNVLAFLGYGQGESANILFVPDDDAKAREALAGGGFSATESRVVCVSGAAGKGAGAKLAARLSKAGINIEYVYATTGNDGEGMAVFGVPDVKEALAALK